MKVSREYWARYVEKHRKLTDTASRKMAEFLLKNPMTGKTTRREALDYAVTLVTRYGEGAAELSCQLYDAVAATARAAIPAAEPAEVAGYGEVAQAVNGTLKFSEKAETVGATVGRLVKMAAEDTILRNAKRDRAEWAWIPQGETCAFCLALASRGWQPASKIQLSGGHAQHIHPHCDCHFAVRFSETTEYEGYNPSAYLRIYAEADGNTAAEKINALRREAYKDEKEHTANAINNDIIKAFRDGKSSGEICRKIIEKHEMFGELEPGGVKEALQNIGMASSPLARGELKGLTFEEGGGFKFNFHGDGILQYHPKEKTHHKGAYWKISSGQTGLKRYGEDGTEIFI